MVSIQRLPVTIQPQQPKAKPHSPSSPTSSKPTAVAQAVASTVRDPELIEDAHSRIQYDQPEGKHRDALASYMGVMHQQRKDELSAMVGVDVYV
ncbi:hypothetical protein C9I98_14820 [Photobacterium sanctipauli]|uniref:Chromosome partitioning protein ParA n=1 Tax=Photobacterium sanctipauli TaxID=1342794 RepID=A0A2T3NR65_9GAMM|nr:hypothetical protein [Photobacterium sanctipauli]PSW18745.1 hypothetical protein C9I98_14820 [Photobacterium sanctipauli]